LQERFKKSQKDNENEIKHNSAGHLCSSWW
jgi:hypothetical protein